MSCNSHGCEVTATGDTQGIATLPNAAVRAGSRRSLTRANDVLKEPTKRWNFVGAVLLPAVRIEQRHTPDTFRLPETGLAATGSVSRQSAVEVARARLSLVGSLLTAPSGR